MSRFKNYAQKTFAALLITTLVAESALFMFPKYADAQGIESYFGGELDIGGLGAIIISCAFPNGIINAIGGLFNGQSTGTNPTGGQGGGTTTTTTSTTTPSFSTDTVPVKDSEAIDSIKTTDKNLSQNKDKKKDDKQNETNGQIDQGNPDDKSKQKEPDGVLVQIRTEEEKDTKKERCFDKIARYLAVKMLDEITLATVEWINSGFDGLPLYLEDRQAFYRNIAVEEINLVTGELSDPEKILQYPFGQAIMESILVDLQQDFYANAQYSLNQVLAHGTAEQFHEDFSIGGWAGYVGIARPANNPFAQYFEAQTHISRRIAGTSISHAYDFRETLQESGGFLSQRECVISRTGEDNYIEASGDDAEYHVPSGGPVPDAVYAEAGYDPNLNTPMTEEQATIIDNYTLRSQCAQWRNVTPGYVVADQITTALNIPTNEILTVDEINESIGLIFDALLNQLVSEGLRSLSGDDPATNVALAQVQGSVPGSVENGINPPPTTTDIITGSGQIDLSLSDVQTEYQIAIGNALPIMEDLVERIRALDYCVPGPNPRWFGLAQTNLLTAVLSEPQFLAQPQDSDDSGQIEQDEVDDANDDNETHYANLIESMTGVSISHSPAMDRHYEFVAFMENLFNQYAVRMQEDFSLTQAPPSTRIFLEGYFNQMDVYLSNLDFMNDYLVNIGNIMPQLIDIEDALITLQNQNGGVLDQNDPNVQAQLSLYDQLSDQIVSEQDLQDLNDSIADMNAYLPVVNDKVNSCIVETTDNGYQDSTQRIDYPFDYAAYAQMPSPDADFLPGVDLGNGNGNSINVNFEGVTVSSPSSGLDVFENFLEAVY